MHPYVLDTNLYIEATRDDAAADRLKEFYARFLPQVYCIRLSRRRGSPLPFRVPRAGKSAPLLRQGARVTWGPGLGILHLRRKECG